MIILALETTGNTCGAAIAACSDGRMTLRGLSEIHEENVHDERLATLTQSVLQATDLTMDNIDVVAVGECGLDYYRIDENDKAEKARQEKELRAQIEFAIEYDLALMLHIRPKAGTMDAYTQVIALLKEYKMKYGDELRGNVHFFVGDMEVSKEFIELGFTLSFTGILTFTNEYDEIVKEAPLDMIVTETDSPYATPVPHRGKRNEPTYVHAVVKRIAELKGLPEKEVANAVVENAYRIFSISD